MDRSTSITLFKSLQSLIPGGVNSAARAFPEVSVHPIVVKEARGSCLIDADDHEFLDLCMGWGALILGHAHPRIVEAVTEQLKKGSTYGMSSLHELKLAEKIVSLLPWVDKVRFLSSGTEATMTAVRMARKATGRTKMVKFEGCYHGHADVFLTSQDVAIFPYNELCTLDEQVACVILEPIQGNHGCVIPSREFLIHLKKECHRVGAVLIFDEVITGFRVGLQGAAGYFGIEPDLTTFGKIIGGGFPVAAVAGKKDLMDALRPLGPVFQGGTLSGNPVGMVAGYTALCELEKPGFYESLEMKTRILTEGLEVSRVGSMFSFLEEMDFNAFFTGCFEEGIFIPPSVHELCFVSEAHSLEEMKRANQIFQRCSKEPSLC